MVKQSDTGYTKEQYLKSETHSKERDILNVLLNDNEIYSIEEVKQRVNEFLMKEVK
ncbi:hypothetical protein ACQKCU_25070 [Heyndrickxia sporothermodurans]